MPRLFIIGENVKLPYPVEFLRHDFLLENVVDDGKGRRVFYWSTVCADCKEQFEFSTGEYRAYLAPRCRSCETKRRKTEKERVADSRVVAKVPPCVEVWRAVQAVGPNQYSLAENAPRRIHGPSLLRGPANVKLLAYTPAEIAVTLAECIRVGWLMRCEVGKRKSGHLIMGYKARPEAFLRQIGLLTEPAEEPGILS